MDLSRLSSLAEQQAQTAGKAIPKAGARVRPVVPKSKRKTERAKPATKRPTLKVGEVRRIVFERERGICRCCGRMAAESMHEIVPKSLGGIVSSENSIAVCGDGVRGCHGQLQRHEITVRIHRKRLGANGFLAFSGGTVTIDGTERGSEPGSGQIVEEWRR